MGLFNTFSEFWSIDFVTDFEVFYRFEKYLLLDFLITFKEGVRFNEYKFWIATKNIWIASKKFVLLPKTFELIQTVFLRMISYTLQNLEKTHSFFWCEELPLSFEFKALPLYVITDLNDD